MKKILFTFFIFNLFISGLLLADITEKAVTQWLVLDPMEIKLPVMSASKDDLKDILEYSHLTIANLWPAENDRVEWEKGTSLEWQHISDEKGRLVIKPLKNSTTPQISYAAFYIYSNRWITLDLKINSEYPYRLFYDGKLVKENSLKDDKSLSSISKVKVEKGKHLIIIKTLKSDIENDEWGLSAIISSKQDSLLEYVSLSTNPQHNVSLKHILDIPLISMMSLSTDGKLFAAKLSQRDSPAKKTETWLEIRYSQSGKLLKSFRGQSKLTNFKWIPGANKYSFTTANKKKTTIWISDINTGTSTPLKSNIQNFGSYQWSPDGSYIIYSISDKSDSTKHGIKKLKGMPDHWPEYRYKESWYRLSYPSGVSQQIIGNNSQMGIWDISLDGQKILFYSQTYDYQDRPFSKLTMYILNVKTMQTDSIWGGRWLNSAKFSPDGKKLLCLGGPSLFGGIGVNLPEEMIPNEYDVQAYIYNLTTGESKAISRDFNPKIEGSIWHQDGIFVIGEDRDYQHLYHYDAGSGKYQKISSGIDVVSRMTFADQASVALISGTSTTHPTRIAIVDLKKMSAEILYDPSADFFKNTKFGDINEWTFDSKFGFTVDGRVYYPPDFDSDKKYPCIVYYYGGTSPVSRSFGGRYPFNYYTANGYVVYVINPAGATGYGQKHSALHVNDWGKITGEQIIEGTYKFLQAHPFVDTDRVGCMGASYGGFMTMYLVTQTDIFSAAISHAGISSLSSYWGEGYWGYFYSSTATAGSYPWNRKDIYVDRSPLFLADSINTPLLLLHGADDTNVPPGESRQLYTALKLLNKPVELLEISGQNHWIMQYDKRKRWTKTIIAWFDYWLKDQPEWWDYLYPEE